MKYLICGDQHITEKSPENRTDNYFETQYNKIKWEVEFANKLNASLIFPGDLFDSYKQSNFILQSYITLLGTAILPIFVVAGQHDLKYHSLDKDDTPLAVLEAAKVIKIVKKETKGLNSIYGSSFEEEIPSVEKNDNFNILLTHRMIIHNDKIWDSQVGFDYAENLLRKHPFHLIVSGDNHHYFHAQVGNKHLFNCGSLMRSTTAQLNHTPRVVLFDTEGKYKEIEIPIKPISEVFNLNKVKEKKERTDRFDSFISGLSDVKKMSLSFIDNLNKYLEENKQEEGVINLLEEVTNERDNQRLGKIIKTD